MTSDLPLSLTEAEFLSLAAEHPVVPVAVEVLGDRETPVALFEKLAGDGDGFLLESVEGGERWGRWSFVGWEPAFTLTARNGRCAVDRRVAVPPGDPLTVLEAMIARYRTPHAASLGLGAAAPPLHTGAVGYLAYDVVRYVEHLPHRPEDDRGLPEMMWQFVGAIAAVDRFRDRVVLMRNVFVDEDPRAQYREAVAALVDDVARIGAPHAYPLRAEPSFTERPVAKATMSREEFEAAVVRAVEYIRAGDAFQVVPSIRLDVDFDGDAFSVYRALRIVNPSPFMYFVRSGSLAVAGSSPELMSRVRDGIAYSRPIAGTIPRGSSPGEDEDLEARLLADPKEIA
ncbi:MAG: anthranilate synthase component I, partial [Actinobacteria bacterium]